MPKYHVHGTVGDKKIDNVLEATVGTEALEAVVKPHMPKAVKDGRASRIYWWEDNVDLQCDMIVPPAGPNGEKSDA